MTRPFRVVTHKNWLAKGFTEKLTERVVKQDFGYDIDPSTAMDTIWWAPGAWVASAALAGVQLPLMSCGPYWLERLPMIYRGRGVKTMTVAESIRRAPVEGEWSAFVKLPEAKLDSFPATTHLRNRHWETTIGQYHLPNHALIQLQDPVNFQIEARFWVLRGKVVAESPYRIGSLIWGWDSFEHARDRLLKTKTYAVLRDFAMEVADEVVGPPGYVLDVGKTDRGQLLVVEANAAWSSGPYDGDPRGVFKAIEASHDFRGEHPEWAWRHNPVLDKARPLKIVGDDTCHWTDLPKDQCGCGETCPNCSRKRHDKTKEKCYLC
jgi:hypothetical protein